jgi:hypothetical protein
MIDIGNWAICLDNSSPMTPVVLDGELDTNELKAIEILLADVNLTRYKDNDFSFNGGWVEYTDQTAWLYGRIAKLFEYTNQVYKIPELVMIERIAYFEYNENDFQDWYAELDMGIPFSSRKLSICINISGSDDYRGGTMEFMTSNKPYPVSRSLGSVVISPTYLLRKINPVAKGKRRQLIAWISSPAVEEIC